MPIYIWKLESQLEITDLKKVGATAVIDKLLMKVRFTAVKEKSL
jgi:hypothetical protein